MKVIDHVSKHSTPIDRSTPSQGVAGAVSDDLKRAQFYLERAAGRNYVTAEARQRMRAIAESIGALEKEVNFA